ncbi:MAG: PRC-barrel domain containing protein [Gaiellaceae bacterium]
MTSIQMWAYRDTTLNQQNLSGLKVEALDGSIGKVDDATNDVDGSFIVVDTGPWIFGKKVMLPAGVIGRVDLDTETVFVNRTKDQIKNAPEYDEDKNQRDDTYRERYRNDLGSYYGPGGLGYRDDELI